MRYPGKGQKGFTLVELLIALTIFAIGLLSLAGMQVTAIQTNSSASSLSAATALAQGVMEEILALDVNHPLIRTNAADATWWSDRVVDGGGGSYDATYDVVRDAPVVGVSTITVTVSNNLGRTINLTGYRRYVD
ncbi:hypothetical protein DESUT3_17060 [Desulfuromonas versatilis]|uniref:Type IV pilus modification protein PilV n=1 Tax=Desulfuromonas versatilis TaxID=2802975 RepID=A0ABM8HRQ4_9BACT|nr:prepilin-type N-terminal cleavage/methylation domain-containing protein [Desulfuromonas versatilis]BCR04637.1 hypothetical protein DESUT3_17060 [Desulfuromonas versatilis]